MTTSTVPVRTAAASTTGARRVVRPGQHSVAALWPADGMPAERTALRRAARTRPTLGPVSSAARALLADAGRELQVAMRSTTTAERFAAAHLAALRAAAAVLAARARPTSGRRSSAWDLLARVAPELGEWAAYFSAGSGIRQAVQAGLPRQVLAREADDMLRQSASFLELAQELIVG